MHRATVLVLLVPGAIQALHGQCADPPRVKPEEVGLSSSRVDALVSLARSAGSDGFAIFKDGRYVGGFGEREQRPIYSVTKPITGLAAGRLFTEGKWTGLDTPISRYLPEFAGDPKGAVTLRQLLSHTSGIRDARNSDGRVLPAWNNAKDWVKAALAQPMEATPGTAYKYNNLGPALIAAAVERTTGERMDRFLARTIFQPLCIGKFQWLTDAAGHAAGYTGLTLSAYDLAKLGQLHLDRGIWNGTRLLAEDWIRQAAFEPSQTVNPRVGLFWFMLVEKARFPLPVMVFHTGDGGQHLMFFPNHGIVVARLRDGADKQEFNLQQLAIDHLIREPRP